MCVYVPHPKSPKKRKPGWAREIIDPLIVSHVHCTAMEVSLSIWQLAESSNPEEEDIKSGLSCG